LHRSGGVRVVTGPDVIHHPLRIVGDDHAALAVLLDAVEVANRTGRAEIADSLACEVDLLDVTRLDVLEPFAHVAEARDDQIAAVNDQPVRSIELRILDP